MTLLSLEMALLSLKISEQIWSFYGNFLHLRPATLQMWLEMQPPSCTFHQELEANFEKLQKPYGLIYTSVVIMVVVDGLPSCYTAVIGPLWSLPIWGQFGLPDLSAYAHVCSSVSTQKWLTDMYIVVYYISWMTNFSETWVYSHLWMHVCVYVCVCVYMCVCVYTCVCVCVYMYYVCVCVYMRVCVCIILCVET